MIVKDADCVVCGYEKTVTLRVYDDSGQWISERSCSIAEFTNDSRVGEQEQVHDVWCSNCGLKYHF